MEDLFFSIIKNLAIFVLKKTNYPQDAVEKKFACIKENNFDKNDTVIMVHGVSVGEINALENLIKTIRKTFPQIKLVVTTGTNTGQDIANKKLSEYTDLITYFPLDCPHIVKKFLNKIKPDIILMAETELWPCFISECKKRQTKLFIINGRISDRTYKSYKLLKPILKNMLNKYSGIYTQSTEDNEKFISLGADKNTTIRMNNLKFDITKPEVNININKSNYKVLLAGSTHSGEDEIILKTYKILKEKYDNLKLIIAPRHINRSEAIAKLINEYGLNYDLRSNNKSDFENIDVLLMDTLGELGKMYFYSDISFIGGSFNKTGGHNPLESIIFSKPVISGASIHNFKDIYAIIKNAKAGFIVKTPDELLKITDKLLGNAEFYNITTSLCDKVFKEQQGALDFVINKIKQEINY